MFCVVFIIKLFDFCTFTYLYLSVKNEKSITVNTEMRRFIRFPESKHCSDLLFLTHAPSIYFMYKTYLDKSTGLVGCGLLLYLYLQFYDFLRQFCWHLGQRLLPAIHDTPLFTRTRMRAWGLLVFDARTTFHCLSVEITVCEELKYNRKLCCISQSVTIAL